MKCESSAATPNEGKASSETLTFVGDEAAGEWTLRLMWNLVVTVFGPSCLRGMLVEAIG